MMLTSDIPSVEVGALYCMCDEIPLYMPTARHGSRLICQQDDYIMIVAARWSGDLGVNGEMNSKAWLEIEFLSARTERVETILLRESHWESGWTKVTL